MQRPDLPRRYSVNAELAQDIDSKFILHRKPPRADQNPKIRRILGAKEFIACLQNVLSRFAHQQVAALRQSRDEARVIYTAIFLCGQKHARVPGMDRKRKHPAAEVRNAGLLQRSQIHQQMLGMIQSFLGRWLEPSKISQVFYTGRLERQ